MEFREQIQESHILRNKAAPQSDLCVFHQTAARWSGCGWSGCCPTVLRAQLNSTATEFELFVRSVNPKQQQKPTNRSLPLVFYSCVLSWWSFVALFFCYPVVPTLTWDEFKLLHTCSSLVCLGKSDVSFVLPSTECRVMKGAKGQRGSAKSPGQIKRSKSPAESSEHIYTVCVCVFLSDLHFSCSPVRKLTSR